MIKESDKYRLLIEHLPYGFAYHQMVLDEDGKPIDYIFLDVNPAFEKMTGLKRETVIGQRITQVLPDIKKADFDWIAVYGKVACGDKVLTLEQYSEPLRRWYEVKAYSDERGFFITIVQDITERRSNQQGLEYQLQCQHLIASVSAIFVNNTMDKMDGSVDSALQKIGKFLEADRSYVFMFSGDRATMDNTHEWCEERIQPQIAVMKKFPFQAVPWWAEHIFNREQIEIFDVEELSSEAEAEKAVFEAQEIQSLVSIPMVSDGKVFGFFGLDFVKDKKQLTAEQMSLIKVITEIIANALAKQKSESEKSLILNTISERVAYFDTDMRLVWANQVAAESIAKQPEEIVGQFCHQLWYQRDEPCTDCPVDKVRTTKLPQVGDVIATDDTVWNLRGYPISNHNNELVGLVKVGKNITLRKQMERNLQESENRFRELVEMVPDAIFVQIDKQFVYVNRAAMDLFGAEIDAQLLGTCVMERFHPDYHDGVLRRIQLLNEEKQAVPKMEQIYLKLDGTSVDVEVAAVPVRYHSKDGALVYARDISERKLLERQKQKEQLTLRHQQKLEAIGVLASGVAHEINNPINGIMNYAQLILDDTEKGSSSAEFAAEIIQETERVSTIVSNLLHFSRQQKQSHSPARIEDIIERTLSLIRTLFRRDQIMLEVEIPSDLPNLKCRSQQIEQVLMNLLTNARDALNHKYSSYDVNKVIRVDCSLLVQNDRRWIRIAVEDHGCGIPEENYEKLFQPFFTTKSRDLGTGLGLAISYGIVKDHHGEITFKTKLGEYTHFYLDLPIDNGWNIDEDE